MKMGVLGNGQLAAMLQEAAPRIGLSLKLFPGPYQISELRDFFQKQSLLIFENEFVDCALLAEAARNLNVRFVPALATIELVQDKLRQKQLLRQLSLPTPDFDVFTGAPSAARGWSQAVLERFGGQAVFKWARQGYDGKGVCVVSAQSPRDAASFCHDAATRGLPLFAEAFVPFVRELAMVAVRSEAGDVAHYPLVISEQERGVCLRVSGPATQLGVDSRLEQEAAYALRRVGEAANIIGSYAIEFFEDAQQRLWVNEIAPRVHNTGHYSQDTCSCSQFENHLRACAKLPLGPTTSLPFFAMRNLLGPADVEAAGDDVHPTPPQADGLHLHWYHKDRCKAGRKMGHLNAAATTRQELEALLAAMEIEVRQWEALVYKHGQST